MTVRFMLLMPIGRVGSNLLLAVLERPKRAMKVDNESLNSISDARAQLDWLRKFYGDESIPYIGAKQSFRALMDPPAIKGFFVEFGVKVVRLRRADLLRAAISQIRAERYAVEYESRHGRQVWGIRPGFAPPLGPMRIEPAGLRNRLDAMAQYDQALLQAFAPEEVLDVTYEELNGDLDATVRKVREYIGLPHDPYKPAFIKATPDDLTEAVSNIDELRDELVGTTYARSL